MTDLAVGWVARRLRSSFGFNPVILVDSVQIMRARCAVCLRPMPLRGDGAIRVHGPVGHRCAGSGKPPSSVGLDIAAACHSPLQGPAPATLEPGTVGFIRPQVPILKRLPQASRNLAARKLATILERVTAVNDITTWMCLLNLPNRCFRVPRRGGHHWNFARLVNQQLEEESDPPHSTGHRGSAPHSTTRQHQDNPDALQFVANKVSAKLEVGDFRGAVCLACSGDSIAEVNNATIDAKFFFEQNTTVNDKSTVGRFDPKVFVNCVQDVRS